MTEWSGATFAGQTHESVFRKENLQGGVESEHRRYC